MSQRKLFRFNLDKLQKLSKNNSIKLIELLERFYNENTNKISGSSFLIKPNELFCDHGVDVLFKAQYIQLAARRSYQQYKDLGHKHLDLTYFPDLNLEIIKYNPLLKIENNKIYFKYEE